MENFELEVLQTEGNQELREQKAQGFDWKIHARVICWVKGVPETHRERSPSNFSHRHLSCGLPVAVLACSNLGEVFCLSFWQDLGSRCRMS